MDKINAVEIGVDGDDNCGNCGLGVTEGKGCCKDEVKVVKLQVDQVVAKLVKVDFSPEPLVPVPVSYLAPVIKDGSYYQIPVEKGPPLSTQDIYLQIRNFRI